ncbi:hypothetical protein HX867_04145 [Pseudomonas gingeri]|uniref:hypothetical protein n=1 Tax=Pseudomonas gingeri TaxID=117681 RepID=UPI0015A4ADB6|nr:hypothetical protein [Pseudomonas gingeri]NVZ61265.1 hypothetical protein [Pseudomonas gingeri]NVZ77161.1 hypothetical protein [Pseudomonas gingeri]
MTDHYVNKDGKYMGGYGDGAKPEDKELINLGNNPPFQSDQIWNFESNKWMPSGEFPPFGNGGV